MGFIRVLSARFHNSVNRLSECQGSSVTPKASSCCLVRTAQRFLVKNTTLKVFSAPNLLWQHHNTATSRKEAWMIVIILPLWPIEVFSSSLRRNGAPRARLGFDEAHSEEFDWPRSSSKTILETFSSGVFFSWMCQMNSSDTCEHFISPLNLYADAEVQSRIWC